MEIYIPSNILASCRKVSIQKSFYSAIKPDACVGILGAGYGGCARRRVSSTVALLSVLTGLKRSVLRRSRRQSSSPVFPTSSLTYAKWGRALNVRAMLLDEMRLANTLQMNSAQGVKESTGYEQIALTAGTDDLREGPVLELVEAFLLQGEETVMDAANVAPNAEGERDGIVLRGPRLRVR